MQLPIGKYYHKTLEATVEVTPICIEMAKRSLLDSTSTFIEHNGEIKEVTGNLLIEKVPCHDDRG